jgi:carbon-monoxide dehydrogenase small subunit
MTESLQTTASAKCEIVIQVNGERKSVRVYPMERLLDVLRHNLGLTGTKEGCGEGECGSCSVLMDGALVNSCLVPVLQAKDARIVTIEGLAAQEPSRRVQQAFLDCGGAQCGICTPGMILAAVHLLEKRARPTMEDIRERLSGNLCRCTGYVQIFEAVLAAAQPEPSERTPRHEVEVRSRSNMRST